MDWQTITRGIIGVQYKYSIASLISVQREISQNPGEALSDLLHASEHHFSSDKRRSILIEGHRDEQALSTEANNFREAVKACQITVACTRSATTLCLQDAIAAIRHRHQ